MSSDGWVILSSLEQNIRQKIETVGMPLKNWDIHINYGIKTGCNEAFIINAEKRQEILDSCRDEDERHRTDELIRPILRGRDIKRYGYNFADLWLICTHNGVKEKNLPRIEISDYPAIKNHLDQYYDQLSKRADKGDTPYNLRNCVYMDDFSKQRIIYREISDKMDACLIEPGIMINNKCYMITGEHLSYLISFINSKLFTKIILKDANITGGKGKDFLYTIHLPSPLRSNESVFEELLNERKTCEPEEIPCIDRKIDTMICELFGLSKDETKFILI